MGNKEPELKSGISLTDLAKIYGVTRKVMKRWIEPIEQKVGEIKGRSLTPKQIKIIINHLDTP